MEKRGGEDGSTVYTTTSSVKTPVSETDNDSDVESGIQELDLEEDSNTEFQAEIEATSEVATTPAPSTSFRGLLYVALSSFLFSVSSFFASLNAKIVPTFEQTFIRGILQTTMSCALLYFILKRDKAPISFTSFVGPRYKLVFLLLRGITGALGIGLFFFALSKLALSVATVLNFLTPIFTGILASVFLKEAYETLDAVCAVIGFIGVLFVAEPEFIFGHVNEKLPFDPLFGGSIKQEPSSSGSDVDSTGSFWRLIGVCAAITSCLFYATTYIAVRQIGPDIHPLVLINWIGVSVPLSLLMIPFEAWSFPPDFKAWAYLILMSVTGFSGQVAINRGVQLEKAGKAVAITYTSIIWALSLDIIFMSFGVPSLWVMVGIILITGGSFAIGIKKYFKEKSK